MKIINNKEFLRNAANYIDVLNTLGGGIVQTNVVFKERKKGFIIRVKAPGINEDAYRVHLVGNQLTITALLSQTEPGGWATPIFHQDFVLSPNVAYDRIRVVYKNGELQVRLPYIETTGRLLPINPEDA